jgi:hypothetical protein
VKFPVTVEKVNVENMLQYLKRTDLEKLKAFSAE